jgi:diguanylate cyclase (GGDEF)-like protein
MQARMATATDLEIISNLEKQIEGTGIFDNERWFIETSPVRTPRLTDYVTLKHAEKVWAADALFGRDRPKRPKKRFDDKFGILAPPSSLHPEFDYWRHECELREVGLALCYFDIDNFKAHFNVHTETLVDRNCLPVLLRAVEAHVFHHGQAYHIGGDEFIILLPNTDKQSAVDFMDRLRLKLPQLKFVGIPSTAHISVGICHVSPECPLTNAEIEQKANDAKRHAKTAAGKNCIVTYRGDAYTEAELERIRPRPDMAEAANQP